MTTAATGRSCPGCGATLAPCHTLIEYRSTGGRLREFAECPTCGRVDHPTCPTASGAQRAPPESDDRPPIDLRWGYDDEAAPSEVTVYEPGPDRVTRWMTVDVDHACDIAACR